MMPKVVKFNWERKINKLEKTLVEGTKNCIKFDAKGSQVQEIKRNLTVKEMLDISLQISDLKTKLCLKKEIK